MRTDLSGGGWIAAASVQFGVVVILGKISARDGLPVLGVLAFRFAIASALLFAALVARRRSVRPARGEVVPLLLLGALGYAVEASFFFLAIARGTASAVTLLFFVYPVIVTALSVALGARAPGALVLGSLLSAVAGAALVVTSSGGIDISRVGVVFAVASAATFACYLVFTERTVQRTTSLVGAAWTSGAAAIALGAFVVATGTGRLPVGAQWWPVVGMGFGTAGAFACLFAGLRRLGAVRTAIVAALEPLSTAALAIAFLDEPARFGTLGGGALILAGAITASIARDQHAETLP